MKQRIEAFHKKNAMAIWVGWLCLGLVLIIVGIITGSIIPLVLAVLCFVAQAIAYI